jgi:hypothetical protein
MKDLANLRRLQIKNDQLSVLLEKRKVMRSKSLIYLGLIVPVLMFVLEFASSDSQVTEAMIATQVMKLIACDVLLWIFPILSIFSMKRKINLMQQDRQKLVEELRHLNN